MIGVSQIVNCPFVTGHLNNLELLAVALWHNQMSHRLSFCFFCFCFFLFHFHCCCYKASVLIVCLFVSFFLSFILFGWFCFVLGVILGDWPHLFFFYMLLAEQVLSLETNIECLIEWALRNKKFVTEEE